MASPVPAVADGTVVGSPNDLHDQTPGALPPNLPIDEADCNFVVIDIGGGAFVLIAHLRLESVKVRAGERVRRGDHIGDVGNTGNSQAPHLYLHVVDSPDGLLANGLPYVFEGSRLRRGRDADFDRAEASGSPLTPDPALSAAGSAESPAAGPLDRGLAIAGTESALTRRGQGL